jgi:hypothetical protein
MEEQIAIGLQHIADKYGQENGMPRMQRLEIETQLVGAVVRPGDKLVICLNRRISCAEADDYEKYVSEKLPGVSVVFVTESSGMAVYREDKGSIYHPDNPHHHLLKPKGGTVAPADGDSIPVVLERGCQINGLEPDA